MIAMAVAAAGCGDSRHDTSSPTMSLARSKARCIPAWPIAVPNSAAPGDTIVLRDAGLSCGYFSRPQTYTVVLVAPQKPGGLPNYGHETPLTSVRVGVRGAFRVKVHLPSSVVSGSAQLGVRGRELDQRLRCPGNASCRYFGAGVVIKRST